MTQFQADLCQSAEFMIGPYRVCSFLGEANLRKDADYISFTGDFGFSGWLPEKKVIKNYLAHESSLLSNFRLNVINLEYMLRGFSGCQLDNQIDTLMIDIFKTAGYGLIGCANNHALDHGVDGIHYNTVQLTEANLAMIGTRDCPVYPCYTDGKKVAIFALTDDADEEDQNSPILGMNQADLALLQQKIADAHFRIAFVHLGSMSSFPSVHERLQTDKLMEIGADLVICTGSHFIKGLTTQRGKVVAYGIGNHMFSFVDSDTEPIGMHVVAGFEGGDLSQLFAIPFHNTIRQGKTGPLDERTFALFKRTLLERSTMDPNKYFSDPRSLKNLSGYLKDFRFSKLKKIKARHITYAAQVLFYHYPITAVSGSLLGLLFFVLLIRWSFFALIQL